MSYDCVSLFLDMFDSMPEQSPTTESKAATTPSVDLFGAGHICTLTGGIFLLSLCTHMHPFNHSSALHKNRFIINTLHRECLTGYETV